MAHICIIYKLCTLVMPCSHACLTGVIRARWIELLKQPSKTLDDLRMRRQHRHWEKQKGHHLWLLHVRTFRQLALLKRMDLRLWPAQLPTTFVGYCLKKCCYREAGFGKQAKVIPWQVHRRTAAHHLALAHSLTFTKNHAAITMFLELLETDAKESSKK